MSILLAHAKAARIIAQAFNDRARTNIEKGEMTIAGIQIAIAEGLADSIDRLKEAAKEEALGG